MAENRKDVENLRWLLHKVALERCHSDNFQVLVQALWKIGILQGTPKFIEAQMAWLRAREKIRKRLNP